MLKRVRFIPQAWVRDYAMDVDPEGECEFMAEVREGEEVRASGYFRDADYLARSPNAPEWVRNWRGPFEFELVDSSPAPSGGAR